MLSPASAGWLSFFSFGCGWTAEHGVIARKNKSMADETDSKAPADLDYEQARLAYTIIESLLEHTRVVSDLIALMAQTLDQDTTKALTQTPVWTAYLDSRRSMERTRAEVEKFAEIMKGLSEE
jgi:hypothetical protein